jgi:hypothetical protein
MHTYMQQEHACGALRNLSMKREVSRRMGEEGALPYMITLLRSPDERIQEQAATLLRNLSVNDENKNKIAQVLYVCVYVCVNVCVCVCLVP